jgi:purine-binding chemotaxis protein CheW
MTLPTAVPTNGRPLKSQISQPQGPASSLQANLQAEEALDPEALAKIWARRAERLAAEPAAENTGQSLKLLHFWLGNDRYGIEVTGVREIFPLTHLMSVPRTPDFVAGVFSARGRILSVIDLRVFFGLPAPAGNASTLTAKIIVVANTDSTSETATMELGILVDEVDDVVTIFKEEITPPLTTRGREQSKYQLGITADKLLVLNLESLLTDKRLIVHEEML